MAEPGIKLKRGFHDGFSTVSYVVLAKEAGEWVEIGEADHSGPSLSWVARYTYGGANVSLRSGWRSCDRRSDAVDVIVAHHKRQSRESK